MASVWVRSLGSAIAACTLAFGCGDESRESGGGAGDRSCGDKGPELADALAGDGPARDICDGSNRLTASIVLGGGGQFEPRSDVLYELGHSFIYVDGQCNYWVRSLSNEASWAWSPVRSGQLSEAEATTLGRIVSTQRLKELAPRCTDNCVLVDAPSVAYANSDDSLGCPNQYGFTAANELGVRLYERGTDLDGPLRVTVVAMVTPSEPAVVFAWPLPSDPAEWAVDITSQDPYEGARLVEDSTAVTALRELRDRWLMKARLPGSMGIDIEGDYRLFFRDELPISLARSR